MTCNEEAVKELREQSNKNVVKLDNERSECSEKINKLSSEQGMRTSNLDLNTKEGNKEFKRIDKEYNKKIDSVSKEYDKKIRTVFKEYDKKIDSVIKECDKNIRKLSK